MPIFALPWSHPLFGLTIFLLGACVGSFLNVVIYRVPRGMSINSPKRSFCPICKKPIPMWRNIPLVTWLLQRGKCAECSSSIVVRYFIVELLNALMWFGCWCYFDRPELAIFYMLLSSVFIVIAVVDIELMVIPRQLTILGTVLGVLMAGLFPQYWGEVEWSRSVLKSLLGFSIGWGSLWLVVLLGKVFFGKRKIEFEQPTEWMLREPESDEEELCFVFGDEVIGWSDIFYRKSDRLVFSGMESVLVDGEERPVKSLEIRNNSIFVDGEQLQIEELKSLGGKAFSAVVPREAMGMGDVDLLGMLGACFGSVSLLLTIFAACIVSIIWAMMNRLGFGKMMPFGPSIIAGAIIWVFWGQDIWKWYLCMMGVE